MADQKMLEYIRENLERGVSAQEIRLSLLGSGWPQADVDAGMAEATGSRAPAREPPAPVPQPQYAERPAQQRAGEEPVRKKGGKKIIVLLIVLAFLVILLLYAALSILSTFSTMYPSGMESINDALDGGGST